MDDKPITARVPHAHGKCIQLLVGDAVFANINHRKWDGREGWQYSRYGYTNVRTRKLRATPQEAMMAAPRVSRADRLAACAAIERLDV